MPVRPLPQGVPREDIRIDGHGADLVPIPGLTVGQDGAIFLMQPQDGVVRVFSPTGLPAGSFGGRGMGPGEFAAMSRMGWLGDTLWVSDSRAARLTLVSPSGDFIRTMPSPTRASPPPHAPSGFPSFPFAITLAIAAPDAVVSQLSTAHNQDLPPAFRGRFLVARVGVDAVIRGVIGSFPTGEAIMVLPGGTVVAAPFANLPRFSVALNGERMVLAYPGHGGMTPDSVYVLVMTTQGDTVFETTYRRQLRPIPRATAESTITSIAARVRDPTERAAFRRTASLPEFYPINGVLIGMDDSVFIEEAHGLEGRNYTVISGDGAWIGSTSLPAGVRLAAACLGRLWGIERDALGVESVVVYRLDWSEPPPTAPTEYSACLP
jgi:hypothetical protein